MRTADRLAVLVSGRTDGVTKGVIEVASTAGTDAGAGPGTTGSPGSRPTVGELVGTLAEHLSTLIRNEIRLAKAEMAQKAVAAGVGIGLFVTAGLLALYAIAVLLAAAVLGLANAVPAWLAALIVGVVLLLVVGVLALLGKKALERSTPPVPERAQASIKADIEAVKEGLGS